MRTVPTVAAAVVGILFVTVLATGSVVATDAGNQSLEPCATESPENFTEPESGDAVGYVDGYWYDQPIRIANDSEDGEGTGGGPDGNATTEGNATDDESDSSARGNGTVADNETAIEDDETVADNETAIEDDETVADNETATDDAGRPLNRSDGLDQREIDAVVARTAARVETQRCLSFQSVPDVQVINRSAVEDDQRADLANRSASAHRFDDARLAAALLLGHDADPAEARAAARSGSTLGYYEPAADRIVLVATDGETRIDEPTLAHELVHALQDQHFELERFDADLTDSALAETGLIEGDAALIQHRYERRCESGSWSSCLHASTGSGGNSDYLALELFFFQPYNDGARFVEQLYEDGGWNAVDARYVDVPASSKALLTPESPSHVEPANVSFETPVDASWQRVTPEDAPNHDVLGPGTIAAAMLAPTFDADLDDEIYGDQHVTNNVDQSTLHPLYPYDYGVDAATGWKGGTLEVYGDKRNETAVRWRTEWEDSEDAETFRERYVELLEVRGDATSGEYADTYVLSGDGGFTGEVSVRRNDTSVVVVHGPSVPALRALDDGAARMPRDGSSSSDSGIDASRRATEDLLMGQGSLGAMGLIVALLGVSAWVVVRKR